MVSRPFGWGVVRGGVPPGCRGRFLEQVSQAVEPAFPRRAALDDPAFDHAEWLWLYSAGAHPAVLLGADQSAVLQDVEMLQDRGKGHRERCGQLRHGGRPDQKSVDDGSSCRVGQGGEDPVEVLAMLKHRL
jgi:hypothetical protein